MLKLVKQTSFLVFVAIFLIIFLPGYAKIQELRQKNRELDSTAKRLHSENLALQQERERLQRDPAYLEQVAREKLGIVKKGEIVYKLVPAEENKK